MEDNKPNNPTAFPQWEHINIEGNYTNIPVDGSGMSLRDYFAAKAMAVFLDIDNPGSVEGFNRVAMSAYNMADAMLKARSK